VSTKLISYSITDKGCFDVTSHSRDRNGYPHITIKGIKVRTHRHAWEKNFGPIPKGFCVCHKCDNPSCVNPDHLFLGTNTDNVKDKVSKGRQSKGKTHAGSIVRGRKGLNVKLSPKDVREIRLRYRPRDRKNSLTVLAKKLGVAKETVREVVIGKYWAWVR
jgi:hypothetical protein